MLPCRSVVPKTVICTRFAAPLCGVDDRKARTTKSADTHGKSSSLRFSFMLSRLADVKGWMPALSTDYADYSSSSLSFGLWFLVFGFWSLSFELCSLNCVVFSSIKVQINSPPEEQKPKTKSQRPT